MLNKYYIASGTLAVVTLALAAFGLCQDNACKDYLGDFKLSGPVDPLAKYQDVLQDPRFAQASIAEIGGRVHENGHCDRYRRAIDSLTLGGDRETVEKKVVAILVYQEADEHMCTAD
jgi:hypothetical protein